MSLLGVKLSHLSALAQTSTTEDHVTEGSLACV